MTDRVFFDDHNCELPSLLLERRIELTLECQQMRNGSLPRINRQQATISTTPVRIHGRVSRFQEFDRSSTVLVTRNYTIHSGSQWHNHGRMVAEYDRNQRRPRRCFLQGVLFATSCEFRARIVSLSLIHSTRLKLTQDTQWMVLLVMEDTTELAAMGFSGAFSFFRSNF